MQSYVIHLIRHGSIEETLKGKYIGATDVHLSKRGREELVTIRETVGYPYPDKVYSSPLLRCTESCELIFPEMDIETINAFSECNFGDWEGKSAAELAGDPKFAEWLGNSDKNPPPNGESGKDFAGRVSRGFERLVEKMSAQAVGGAVGHNPICIIVPCHRVVGANGSLTGYGGGIMRKKALLELEGIDTNRFTVPKKGTAL